MTKIRRCDNEYCRMECCGYDDYGHMSNNSHNEWAASGLYRFEKGSQVKVKEIFRNCLEFQKNWFIRMYVPIDGIFTVGQYLDVDDCVCRLKLGEGEAEQFTGKDDDHGRYISVVFGFWTHIFEKHEPLALDDDLFNL